MGMYADMALHGRQYDRLISLVLLFLGNCCQIHKKINISKYTQVDKDLDVSHGDNITLFLFVLDSSSFHGLYIQSPRSDLP